MNTEVETVYEDQRGRMKLKIIRKNGKYGPRFSAMVYRPYKKGDGENGKTVWAETHWLDEQDVLNSLRLHEVADDLISEAKQQSSANKEAA